jgi:hypothetical protein
MAGLIFFCFLFFDYVYTLPLELQCELLCLGALTPQGADQTPG